MVIAANNDWAVPGDASLPTPYYYASLALLIALPRLVSRKAAGSLYLNLRPPTAQAHNDDQLYLVEAGGSTCLCDLQPPIGSTTSQGTIGGASFRSNCGPAPLGEMQYDAVWDNKTTSYTDNGGVNPTCQLKA